ncbi:hypothetical protein JRO89_XS08G0014000 [Xanthoceras sorbifolium]|uniref:TIR domain-containing protein n=1 Tax=Xanthoceras sorbifolium TaxID=99658 RepID=A0ABQ8HN68_9ROSI|nr:hypothetical protein JRO89_XS08G0014000 [Xanthoceras sorbifolium]
MASSYSCCSDTTTRGTKFDVFLSFRCEDTRYTFTSHLYAALSRTKIETFIDYQIRKGDDISPALSKTIEDSCLSIGQIILPVFYHALPSDVRKQTGSYGEAFAKHEKCFKKTKDKVSNWRAALNQVANLSGWDIKEHDGLNEAGLVENVEDQEDLNSKTLEETEHKSESEGKGRVKLMSKKIFVVGLALFFLVVVFIGKCK